MRVLASTHSIHAVEVIKFEIPQDSCKIFVGNLSQMVVEDDLTSLFRPFGLLYQIRLFKTALNEQSLDGDSSDGCVGNNTSANGYAIVTMFSAQAAIASLELDGTLLHGRRLKVNKLRRKPVESALPTESKANILLQASKCIDLMNYYFCMRWTSSIISMDCLGMQQESDQPAQVRGSFRCQIRLVIDKSTEIFGVGNGECVGELYEVVQKGKKTALSNARKDAFSRLAIVCLPSGKVAFFVSPAPLVSACHSATWT